jgi:hypothetical protein
VHSLIRPGKGHYTSALPCPAQLVHSSQDFANAVLVGREVRLLSHMLRTYNAGLMFKPIAMQLNSALRIIMIRLSSKECVQWKDESTYRFDEHHTTYGVKKLTWDLHLVRFSAQSRSRAHPDNWSEVIELARYQMNSQMDVDDIHALMFL